MADPARSAGRSDSTWRGAPPPPQKDPGLVGWALIVLRGSAIALWLVVTTLLILPLRCIEAMVAGPNRPVTGPYVQLVCRVVLAIMGLRFERQGIALEGPGAVVANHSGWLDIFAANATMPVFFVAKTEVSNWPGINVLTWVTNTQFLRRDPREAAAQAHTLSVRMRAGHHLLFFPEGTSSDGLRLLPFKPALFQAFFAADLPSGMAVQPLSLRYQAPEGADPAFYGWWGDMALGPHLLSVLASAKQGCITATLHPPIPVWDETRKSLAEKSRMAIESGLNCAPLVTDRVALDVRAG